MNNYIDNNYSEYYINLNYVKINKAVEKLIKENIINIDFIINKIFWINECEFGEISREEIIEQVNNINNLKADSIRAVWSINNIKLEFKKFINCELIGVFYQINILY